MSCVIRGISLKAFNYINIKGEQKQREKSQVYSFRGSSCIFAKIFLNLIRAILSIQSVDFRSMKEEMRHKLGKNMNSQRRRNHESSQFQSQITLQLDELFRYFNYYYPGKNKEQIINKCMTGNAYWITVDSQYYPETINFEIGKIQQLRKKSTLKNGVYPSTKDPLEEQKFILMVRKLLNAKFIITDFQQIKKTPISTVTQELEDVLLVHEANMTHALELAGQALDIDTKRVHDQLESLGIPPVKSSNLFAYEKLEKEIIDQLVNKARRREEQPRCQFCFTRDKDIVKCKGCQLYVHPSCYPRPHKYGEQLICDQCRNAIPESAQCQLCPLQGGNFLQLIDDAPFITYRLTKGETALRFKIIKDKGQIQRQFIHTSCFVLHPECFYNVKRGRVDGIHHIDRSRKNMSLCLICGNMIGLTVPCNNESCRRAYHPECARRNNLKINVIKANNKSLLEIYCERHKKPQSYEFLNDSVSNRIKQLRKFYQSLDYEIKRGSHNLNRQKRQSKVDQHLKWDLCLVCGVENTFEMEILNCRRCYGWKHATCSTTCPLCDL